MNYAEAHGRLADAKAAVEGLVVATESLTAVQLLHGALGHLEAARLELAGAARVSSRIST